MATISSSHSRTSSTGSSSNFSRSSSPVYRLFPRTPKPSRGHPQLPALLPYTLSSSFSSAPSTANQRHITPSTARQHQRHQLTTSIERATVPMLAHLHSQLRCTHLEPEQDRVRRQIQRQETVLTLSMLLKVWGEDGDEDGCSGWSDDSEKEEEEEDHGDEDEEEDRED